MDLRYPIGKFVWPKVVSETDRRHWIQDIVEAPVKLRAAIIGLSENQKGC